MGCVLLTWYEVWVTSLLLPVSVCMCSFARMLAVVARYKRAQHRRRTGAQGASRGSTGHAPAAQVKGATVGSAGQQPAITDSRARLVSDAPTSRESDHMASLSKQPRGMWLRLRVKCKWCEAGPP